MARLTIQGQAGAAPDWAARAVLLGHDVGVTGATSAETYKRAFKAARAVLPVLFDIALPPEGACTFHERAPNQPSHADWTIDARTQSLTLDGGNGPAPLRAAAPIWLFPVVSPDAPADFCAAMGVGHGDIELPAVLAALVDQDRNAMVAAMRAIKARGSGIGAILAQHETQLAPHAPPDLSAPPVTLDRIVPPDWVDYNGHMNEARYLTAFSDATDRLLLWAGMDAACVAEGRSVFTVETHIQHLGEVDIGDRITVVTHVLDGAGKRLHLWHELYRDGACAATAEQLLLHIDLNTRRVGLPRSDVGAWLSAAGAAQAHMPRPKGLGRFVGAPRI
ncbi:MAG: thioesterase family protein [Pseudomonadota bacterium]